MEPTNMLGSYLRHSGRALIVTAVTLVIVMLLPHAPLFENRSAGMLHTHLLLELFSIMVSVLIVGVSWTAFDEERQRDAGILIAGFLAAAAVDLLHALSYDGMPALLSPSTTTKAIFFWLTGRAIVVVTLLLLALDLQQRLSRLSWLGLAAGVSALVFWVGTFHLDWVPYTFAEGHGVTAFKTACEFALLAADVAVATLFIRRATPATRERSFGLATACLVMGAGGTVFAFYKSPSDLQNIFGHVFKIASFVFLYRAIFVAAIRAPYQRSLQAEAQLARLNAGLEHQVQARTAQLERVNKELSEFSYVISHDLKAPLRGITSLVGWIEQDYKDKLDEPGRDMLRLLGQRSHRMHRLIEDVLEYSRVGRAHETRTDIDTNRVVHEVADSLHPPPHITVRVEGELPRLHYEPTKMQQVFQNLLSNAIKYMDKEHGEITVSAVRDGPAWRFCVADNGPGIDPRHHERIFQIFQTVHGRQDTDSTGVGLSIVKKIIEGYEGRIWVESAEGAGTRFYFTLPALAEEPA